MRREGFAHEGEVCYPLSTVYARRLAAPCRTRILRMHPPVCARTVPVAFEATEPCMVPSRTAHS